MGIKQFFLNNYLREEAYMIILPSVSYNPYEVCKIGKTLYGLKDICFEKLYIVITFLFYLF